MRRLLIGGVFGAMVCIAGIVGPAIPAAYAQATSADDQKRQDLCNALANRAKGSNDADARSAAAEAERLVNKEPWNFRRPAKPVVEALMAAKRYEPAERLARAIILGAPSDWWLVNNMQQQRVEAYLRQGKWDEALGAAKGLYNYADFRQMAPAIDEVARVLAIADPREGAAKAKRFKEQQQAWATKAPADGDALGRPVLADVKVDPAPFDKFFEQPAHSNIYTAAMARGQVLLLADKPLEAIAAFREAGGLAAKEPRRTEAALAMARAMRARDQYMAGAKEYLDSLQIAVPTK